uniref:Beta-amylase n=1 Tax=Rhizophora mucronata TaxID=61149 RepID=A0A2P2L3E2_RHIMU
MSARAGRGKLPYCLRPASIRLVMARRWRSRSFVLSFSFSLSLLPLPEAFEVLAVVVLLEVSVVDTTAAKPRGRRG